MGQLGRFAGYKRLEMSLRQCEDLPGRVQDAIDKLVAILHM